MSEPMFRPHPIEWTADKVRRVWDYYALHPVEFFSATHSQSIAAIVRHYCRRGPVADIGCGTGDLLVALIGEGLEVVGVDDSPEIVAAARRRLPGATLAVASATSLPFEDASMGGVLLVEVIEHLDDETLNGALVEARRVLRTGGRLVITTPNQENIVAAAVQCPDCGSQFHPMQHVRSWSAATLARALSSHGFQPESVRPLRLVENGSPPERLARRAYYAIRRQRPHLVAVGTRSEGRAHD
jgi:SAM-dependent methyltransferase